MPAVLQITPFPIPEMPIAGGQKRVAEFAQAFEALDFRVTRSVVHVRAPAEPGRFDVSLTWRHRKWRRHLGRPGGLANIRQMWALNGAWAERYARRLPLADARPPSLIQVEHPWAFGLAHALRQLRGWSHTRIAYDAHNIESDYQAAVWKASGQWTSAAARLVRDVARHEARVAAAADLCWATCEADARALTALGARSVVVVPNGVSPIAPRDPLADVPRQPYLLFVSSGYPIDVSSLMRLLPAPLDWLPPGCRIVLAGAVGGVMARSESYRPDFDAGRLLDAGVLPKARLDQLIRHSRGMLLPIHSGAGTNLKTAEALLSCRPVIATPFSLRGFEPFARRARVSLADDPAAFARRASDLLLAPWQDDAEDPAADQLLWSSGFACLPQSLAALGVPAFSARASTRSRMAAAHPTSESIAASRQPA